jgi:hypothetical protein
MRELGGKLPAFERVNDALEPDELQRAVRAIASHFGGKVERLLGVLEQLQEPLALVRERLQIRGMDLAEARNFRDKARMKDVLRANGIPCARHRLCHTSEEGFAFAREVLPLVAKRRPAPARATRSASTAATSWPRGCSPSRPAARSRSCWRSSCRAKSTPSTP